MRSRNRRHAVPEDGARLFWIKTAGAVEVLDALGIQMNFAVVGADETLKQLGEGTLGAMPAVNEGRNDGEPQVSESTHEDFARLV
jgi:hypothetical protein